MSDGTVEGTVLFKDINPGVNSSWVAPLGELGGHLFFYADAGDGNGRRLWVTDGEIAANRSYDHAYKMVVQDDGKILVVGQATTLFGLVRYNISSRADDWGTSLVSPCKSVPAANLVIMETKWRLSSVLFCSASLFSCFGTARNVVH